MALNQMIVIPWKEKEANSKNVFFAQDIGAARTEVMMMMMCRVSCALYLGTRQACTESERIDEDAPGQPCVPTCCQAWSEAQRYCAPHLEKRLLS
jgi:hypothetical protein